MLSKVLSTLLSSTLLAAPAIAAPSQVTFPDPRFVPDTAPSRWTTPSFESPRSLRFESASAGTASWYGPGFYGNRTANGEVFRPGTLTAAHRTLPFGTKVRVTNLWNGRSTVVRINDRGPFYGDRVIDLSGAAASELRMISSGTAPVSLKVLR
jgi:rare lipoprotein A